MQGSIAVCVRESIVVYVSEYSSSVCESFNEMELRTQTHFRFSLSLTHYYILLHKQLYSLTHTHYSLTYTSILSHIHYYTLSHTLLYSLTYTHYSLTYTSILSHVHYYALSRTLLYSLTHTHYSLTYTSILSHIHYYTLSHT